MTKSGLTETYLKILDNEAETPLTKQFRFWVYEWCLN